MNSEGFELERRAWADQFYRAVRNMEQPDLYAMEGALDNGDAQEFFDIFREYLQDEDGENHAST